MATRRPSTVVAASQVWRWLSDARRFEAATRDAHAAQRSKLLAIVKANRDTAYGREHGFSSIEDIDDFQRNVPINTYETLEPYVNRMAAGELRQLTADDPLMFAQTSGTTGKQKLL